MTRHRRTVGMAAMLLLPGCGIDRLAFAPRERIRQDNLDRLRQVSCRKFAHPTALQFVPDWPQAIGPVAVSGGSQVLYVHHRFGVGLAWNSPVSVDVYGLKSGK